MEVLCPPFALIPPARPETIPLAVLHAPHVGAVLMPVTYEDTFFDDLGAGLPAHSVKFLNRAASWSARNSRSGFVTATAAGDLSDDADRDTGPLKSAGIIRRAGKGGWQIVAGVGITIVNARDAAEQARQEQTEAVRTRELGRIRAQRKRDKDKAARLTAMSDGVTRDVTQESRETGADVTRHEPLERKKPQVKAKNVTRYDAGSSRVTPQVETDRSDQDQSSPVGFNSNHPGLPAHARKAKPRSPEFRLHVITAFAAKHRTEITTEEADSLAAEVLGRAKERVPSPLSYVLTAIANEKSPFRRWFPGREAPAAEPRKPAALDWCGKCDPVDRRVYNDAGQITGHCPDCSPRSFAAQEAIAS